MSEEKNADTIIGEDIVFKGVLRFNNSLRLKGKMKGTIESSGELIIDDTGSVEADVNINSIFVNGSLRGNVDAKVKVEIGNTGKVIGDIKTPVLQIQSGAKFSGNSIM
jgi:cytoskeletal protein CcmA (bactofilin family)